MNAAIARADLRNEDLDDRRAQIARLQPSEQQELLRRQERFSALPAEEQQRLRTLQAAIDADRSSERLHQVLVRYHEWLKTLTPSQRARLADLTPQDRVNEIKRIQQQQHALRDRIHQADLLSWGDMREVIHWTEDYVWTRRQDLLSAMSKEQREKFDKWDRQRQKRVLTMRAFERARREGGAGLATLEQVDIDRLSSKLSEPARRTLAEGESLQAQRKILANWIGIAIHRLEVWPGQRKQNPMVVDELLQFLQNEVPPTERERLLKMPREKMLEELRGMYFERGRPAGRSGGGGPPWLEGRGTDRIKGSYRSGASRGPTDVKKDATAEPAGHDSGQPEPPSPEPIPKQPPESSLPPKS